MTLTEFLLARIAEDKYAAASGARFESWNRSWDTTPTRDLVINGARVAAIPMDYDEHIARWDPARVLAECEAKRRLVNYAAFMLKAWHDKHSGGESAYPDMNRRERHTANVILETLAEPYADHPDYDPHDPTWRP